jgi:hypothetical protein
VVLGVKKWMVIEEKFCKEKAQKKAMTFPGYRSKSSIGISSL